MYEITMLYQPIVTVDKDIFGYEALVRGNSAVFYSPEQLLDDARKKHALPLLEEKIFEQTLEKAEPGNKIFFNLTKESATEQGFIERLFRITEKKRVATKDIVLEVSENAFWDSEEFVAFCEKSASFGFIVALDDFGTRGANLSLIRNGFPDCVKIARELVAKIDIERYRRTLVFNLVETMLQIDVCVVVEGVERVEEFNVFANLPVLFQGYLFGKPAPR
jgi:EAL domain-containing protein (putative c-di-GMP-specific phosphodiesterase class I)